MSGFGLGGCGICISAKFGLGIRESPKSRICDKFPDCEKLGDFDAPMFRKL